MQQSEANESGAKGRVKLARNVIFSGATSFAEFFLLLLLIAAGRFLGVEQFGTFSVALAATTILVFSTNLGLDALIIRYLAIDKDTAAYRIGAVLAWKLILAVGCAAIFLLLANILVTDELTLNLIYVLTPAALLRSVNMSFRSYFQGFERFEIEAVIVLFDRIVIFIFGFTLLWMNGDALQLAWVFVVVRSITLLLLVSVFRAKVCRFKLILDFHYAKDFQLEAIPLGLVAIVNGLNAQIDVLMLSYFEPRDEIGLFSSAHKIYEGSLAVCLILNPAFYPRLSKLFVADIDRHRDLAVRALKYLLLLGVPLATVGFVFSESLVVTLFGASYLPTTTTLSIILFGAALILLVAGAQNILFSIGQQKTILYIMLVGLLSKFALNLILIPAFGKVGAASSLAIAAFVMVVMAIIFLQKNQYKLASLAVPAGKIVLAALIAAVVLHFIDIDYRIKIIMFAAMYVAALFMLRIFDRFEVDILRKVTSKIISR